MAGTRIVYTPTAAARHIAASATGAKTDTFTVTVTDGYGGSTPVTVTVDTAPSNTAPVADTQAAGTVNATTGVVTGTVSASDPNGDVLTYVVPTASVGGGAVTINARGGYTFTPTVAVAPTVESGMTSTSTSRPTSLPSSFFPSGFETVTTPNVNPSSYVAPPAFTVPPTSTNTGTVTVDCEVR